MGARHKLILSVSLATAAFLFWKFFRRYSFAGKRIVITGGSRGLGLAIARRLAREGASLAILARDDQELTRAKDDLKKFGVPVATWRCDVKSESDVRSTIEAIGEELGGIDVLINNAGEIVVGPLFSMTRKDFEDALQIHFWAPLSVTLAALPYLKRQNSARIANIASFGGKVAVPHLAPYCVSKFALVGFSDVLRAELASEKIQVTTVAPGLMRTGSHKNAFFKGDYRKEFAWFSLGAANPLASINADRAAHQILNAIRQGKADITVTLAAKLAVILQALFPSFTAFAVKLVSRFLPRMPIEGGTVLRSGWQSESNISPSVLTWLADRASERFNELRESASAGK
jgi:NAD(P)-dependent dehydrogenase (short-subunit alcohol dehydrogenase family)